MKDPFEKELTPYEVLEISTNASQREIQQALGKLLHSGKKISDGVKARHQLSNILGRLEIDLFCYSFDEIRADALLVEENFNIQDYCESPEPDADELFPDLSRHNHSDDFSPITFHNVSLQRIDAYDEHAECDLEEDFDR
jgi:hypothetical protein